MYNSRVYTTLDKIHDLHIVTFFFGVTEVRTSDIMLLFLNDVKINHSFGGI